MSACRMTGVSVTSRLPMGPRYHKPGGGPTGAERVCLMDVTRGLAEWTDPRPFARIPARLAAGTRSAVETQGHGSPGKAEMKLRGHARGGLALVAVLLARVPVPAATPTPPSKDGFMW